MATLEKIRSKQKLLFAVVIVALFLFIISIADANSVRNLFGMGPGSTIAQVGGVKIDHEMYRERIDRANQQNQQNQQDRDVLSQTVINQLLGEALMNEQYDKLGIEVTDAEISRAMTGAIPHPAATRFITGVAQALQLPSTSGSALLDAINNPGRYNLSNEVLNQLAQYYFGVPTLADAWAATEKDVEMSIKQQAFGKLMGGLFTANEIDAKSVYNDNTTTGIVSYVTSPYSSIADSEVHETDADLKAKWGTLKPMFKIKEETRELDFILVPVQPSKADYDAAEVQVDKAVESLRADSGNVMLASQFMLDNKQMLLSDVKKDSELRMMPDSLIKKGSVYKFPMMQNNFRIAKVTDITAQIDSINISAYAVADKAKGDSVLQVLVSGEKKFKDFATENPQTANDSVWMSLVGAPANLVSVFENAVIGQPFVYNDSVQGTTGVYVVNKRNAPRQYADIAVYNYVVDPSVETVSDIKSKLSGFMASNGNGDKFSQNADSLYHLRHTRVSASTPKLDYNPMMGGAGGVADTRHAIQWAMKAKKGEVSPIFEDNKDYYVVVAVKDIYDAGYIPYTSPEVKEQLTALVKADKKGDKLVDKYQGKAKDLPGYASLMGGEVLSDSAFVFTSSRIGTLGGNEYEIVGKVAAAQPGKVVGPVKGANEVMVFVVNGTNKNERPYNFQSDGQTFVGMFGFNDPFSLLAGDRKIKNNSLKFENYDK